MPCPKARIRTILIVMDSLAFYMPGRVIFGLDSRLRLGTEARRFGSRALVITETAFRSSALLKELRSSLESAGVETISYAGIGAESTSRAGEECLDLAKSARVQMIIGFGGLRVLSLAKAVAAFGAGICDLDSLKEEGEAGTSVYPYIEVPTSCRNPFMLREDFFLIDARNRHSSVFRRREAFPNLVVLDPRYAAGLSERNRSAILLDTMLSSLEGYFSQSSNFISNTIFLRSLGLLAGCIGSVHEQDPSGPDLCLYQAGLLSAFGLTMGSPGMGSAVAITAGGLFQVPKSGIAALMLPVILEYGRRACPAKLARMAPILEEDTRRMGTPAAADTVIASLRRRIDSLQLPLRFSDYGLGPRELPVLADAATAMGLADQMPQALDQEELLNLLKEVL